MVNAVLRVELETGTEPKKDLKIFMSYKTINAKLKSFKYLIFLYLTLLCGARCNTNGLSEHNNNSRSDGKRLKAKLY